MKRSEDYPTPLRSDGRICFGIDYFATEEEAQRAAKIVRQRNETYNGGWFHGSPCGREPERDVVIDGVKHYAVTTR